MGGFMSEKTIRAALAAVALAVVSTASIGDTWKPIRSGSSGNGWQKVVCDRSGSGWRSCNMGLTIAVQANPGTIAAVGEQAVLVATVTDYDGNSVGKDVPIRWTTTDGTLNLTDSTTNENGQVSVVITSSNKIGGATVTATATQESGTGQVFVPFSDKWVPTSAVYTGWQNYDPVHSCTGWTPDPSTVMQGTAFTQSAICYQNQVAYQQNRETSVITGQVRNSGNPIPLYQTVQVTVTQQAMGTKAGTPTCQYVSLSHEGASDAVGFIHNGKEGEKPSASTTGFSLYVKGYTGLGMTNTTDFVDYNGRRYTLGDFEFKICQGKNCVTQRMEYEACSVPL